MRRAGSKQLDELCTDTVYSFRFLSFFSLNDLNAHHTQAYVLIRAKLCYENNIYILENLQTKA